MRCPSSRLALVAAVVAASPRSRSTPTGRSTMIVPFPPGGVADTVGPPDRRGDGSMR